jgi:hypothetical protein
MKKRTERKTLVSVSENRRFPPGEFVPANREKSNLIGWRQTLITSPNHIACSREKRLYTMGCTSKTLCLRSSILALAGTVSKVKRCGQIGRIPMVFCCWL